MRVPSDRPARNGGWLHGAESNAQPAPVRPSKTLERAEPERCDRAYRGLLGALRLTARHRANLLDRGLTAEAIERGGYRSLLLGGRAAIARRLAIADDPAGVPGFFQHESGHWSIAGSPGLLVPVRDVVGRIAGIQIRRDEGTSKYLWLSSTNRPGGASSGSPVHVARPLTVADQRIWLTEGPLKADVVGEYLDAVVLAVAGVGNWRDVPATVAELAAGPVKIVLAFDQDADPDTRATVEHHQRALALTLFEAGHTILEATWDGYVGKGLDDVVVAGGYVTVRPWARRVPAVRRAPTTRTLPPLKSAVAS